MTSARRLGPVTTMIVAVVVTACGQLAWLQVASWTLGARPVSGPVADGDWVGRTRAWFAADGFHAAEVGPDARDFSWTRNRVTLLIPALDRSVAYEVGFLVRSGRPPASTPELTIAVDGRVAERVALTNAPRRVAVAVPPSRSRSATLSLAVSDTFVPGPEDTRRLGIVVEGVDIARTGGNTFPVPLAAALAAAGGASAFAAMSVLCGWSVLPAIGLGLIAGLGQAWLLMLDAAWLGGLVWRLLRVAMGVLALGSVVALVRRLGRDPDPDWSRAAAIVIVAAALKLAFFLHPSATVGDAVFQVHRAMRVARGSYFFTSVTPRPYFEFPYPVALYVAAMPFWRWFPGVMDRVVLLRGVSIVTDAAVSFALFFVVRRCWQSRIAAFVAPAVYPLIGVSLQTLCAANLTNVFGQAVFGLAMALLVWRVGQRHSMLATGGLAVLFAIAFLSHFSTVAVGVPIAVAAALSLSLAREADERSARRWVIGALALAVLLSYGLYYSRFHRVYSKTWQQIAAREERSERSMAAPPSVKLTSYVRRSRESFGDPLLLASLAGAVWLLVDRRRDPLTLVLWGWGAATGALAILGILTPLEMRANLAAQPVVACWAGYATRTACRSRRVGPIVIAVIVGWIAVDGARDWIRCLTE
jgi:hypothetical protein